MKDNGKTILLVLLGLALAGGCAWWWNKNMIRVPTATLSTSDAARKNPALAATRLLQQHKHPVSTANSLGALNLATLPDGVMIIANSEGIATQAQAQALLAWVRRGNVLVSQPRWMRSEDEPTETSADSATEEGDADEEASDAPPIAAIEHDPVGSLLGVRRTDAQQQPGRCGPDGTRLPPVLGKDASQGKEASTDKDVRIACLILPGTAHVIELDTQGQILLAQDDAVSPGWSDVAGEAVRGYRLQDGHVVLLASDLFSNRQLRQLDHAELLVHLAGLRGPGAPVTLVQRLDVTPWLDALWNKFGLAMISVAVFLLLWLWTALRRFGPLLPAPAAQRRSLMEHVAASGAWLWKAPGGSDSLLGAVRSATLAIVQRRLPALNGMSPAEQAFYLSKLGKLLEAELQAALLHPAAHLPIEFTRQIRTLQELRNHHER